MQRKKTKQEKQKESIQQPSNTKKVLLFDIETSPNLGYTWGKYEQNVVQFTREGYMMTFAYKWLGEKKVHAFALPDFTRYKTDKHDDVELVTKLWKLFDEADVIVAHHGDAFDIKKANAYFAKAGLTPPSPYKTVDTKKVAKRFFYFNSNKLDDLGNYLKLGRKVDTGGFELWTECMAGNPLAWSKMIRYNKQDVLLLERIYLRLLPWITNHPDVINYITDEPICSNCGGKHLQKRGFAINRNGKKIRYHCQDCGAWSLSKLIKE